MSKELAQDPYVAARAESKPVTPRTKGVKSTNEPPRLYIGLTVHNSFHFFRRPVFLLFKQICAMKIIQEKSWN